MPKSMNKRRKVKNSRKLRKMKRRGGATEEEKAKLAAGAGGLLGSLKSTLNPAAMSGVMSGAIKSATQLERGGGEEEKSKLAAGAKEAITSEVVSEAPPTPDTSAIVSEESNPEVVSEPPKMAGGSYKSKRRKNKMNYKKKSKKH